MTLELSLQLTLFTTPHPPHLADGEPSWPVALAHWHAYIKNNDNATGPRPWALLILIPYDYVLDLA